MNLQMNYKLSRNNFPKPLIGNLPQRNTILCDLKIVSDHGEVWIFCKCGVFGGQVLQDSSTNIVLLPGVSKVEMEEFLGKIYMGKRKDTFSSPAWSPQRQSDSPTYQLQPQSSTKTSYSTYLSPHHHSSPSHLSQR